MLKWSRTVNTLIYRLGETYEMNNHLDNAFNDISVNSVANKSDVEVNYIHSCSVVSCLAAPISRCGACSKYYCYEHLHMDLHPLENVEIINQFKNNHYV